MINKNINFIIFICNNNPKIYIKYNSNYNVISGILIISIINDNICKLYFNV